MLSQLKNMGEIYVQVAQSDDEFEKVYDIRRKVFIEEQEVPEEIEFDEYEFMSEHFLAYYDGEPAGCARWRITPFGKVKLERFAVVAEFRHKGVASAVIAAVLEAIPKNKETYLHAQIPVIPLYEQFGFETEGEIFLEADIEHKKMVLKR